MSAFISVIFAFLLTASGTEQSKPVSSFDAAHSVDVGTERSAQEGMQLWVRRVLNKDINLSEGEFLWFSSSGVVAIVEGSVQEPDDETVWLRQAVVVFQSSPGGWLLLYSHRFEFPTPIPPGSIDLFTSTPDDIAEWARQISGYDETRMPVPVQRAKVFVYKEKAMQRDLGARRSAVSLLVREDDGRILGLGMAD